MESQDHFSLQERINNLSWRERAELLHQLSPSYFRAICEVFVPCAQGRPDEQLIEELAEAFEVCPPEMVERAATFLAIWETIQVWPGSRALSRSRYARFADAVSDLLADERTPESVYNIVTQAVIEIGNLAGQSAEAFAKQTRLWLPAALEELEASDEVVNRGGNESKMKRGLGIGEG